MSNYPLLIAGSAEGSITVWGTRGATDVMYECLGRYKTTFNINERDLHHSITCGAAEVLNIRSKHKYSQSDSIVYDTESFE